ncbi:MAG: cupin domain-containing protein [Acidobacteria bacterium]|nr:cupin domain-containing protein [Acidobacteriota bacterium]
MQAQAPAVATLLTKDIPEFKCKEVTMLTVTYAPGQSSSAHRHHSHVFVYVLEGSVVMQVAGGEPKELGPGGTFYEKPSDIHVTSKNASTTAPAKFLVMMLKDKDKPVSEPVAKH